MQWETNMSSDPMRTVAHLFDKMVSLSWTRLMDLNGQIHDAERLNFDTFHARCSVLQ